jgi:hypothetical protein
MQPNSSATPVGKETWEQRSMEYDDDLEAILNGIVQPNNSRPTIGDDIPSSGGFIIIDGLPTPQLSYGEIAASGYAPLAIREQDIPVAESSIDLDFSSGGEIAHFHGEYLASSQELLRQIQSGSVDPSDSLGIPEHSTTASPSKRQYLTKLQFGGIVAACMLAGAAIYACLNPSILAPLTATQVVTVAPSTTVNNLSQSVQSPNLAANEFTPLNVSTTSTIPAPSTLSNPDVNPATDVAPNSPVAIPYNPATAKAIPPTGNAVRVNLSDSLVKTLLPPNFQSTVKPMVRNRQVGRKP